MFLANYLLRPTLVSRKEWKAKNSKGKISNLKPEVEHVVVSFSETPSCSNKQECSERVRELQNKHIEEEGEPDIFYNFLIGGDGNVYEGRGWELAPRPYPTIKKSLEPLRENFIEIAFIGGMEDERPSVKMLKAMMGLLIEAVNKKVVAGVKNLKPCMVIDGKPYYLRDELLSENGEPMGRKKILEQYNSFKAENKGNNS